MMYRILLPFKFNSLNLSRPQNMPWFRKPMRFMSSQSDCKCSNVRKARLGTRPTPPSEMSRNLTDSAPLEEEIWYKNVFFNLKQNE